MTLRPSDTSEGGRTSLSEDEQIARIIEGAWNSKLVRAGVPPRYRDAESELGTRIYLNAEERQTGAYLYGSTGTGKTYAACAAVIKALKAGRDARYTTTHDLLGKLKGEFDEERKWVSRQIASAWLLVLDEAGEGDCTKWGVSELFDTINDRYNRLLPTIICSNFDPKELMDRWGVDGVSSQRILSRLSEMCVMRRLEGEDRRLHG